MDRSPFSRRESELFPTLLETLRGREDDDKNLVWLLLSEDGEAVTLFDQHAQLAIRHLPKYDLIRQTTCQVPRRGEVPCVSIRTHARLGPLLSKLLFEEGRKVEIYQLDGDEFKMTHSASPGSADGVRDFFADDQDLDDAVERPLLAVECKVEDLIPRFGLFVLSKGAKKVSVCTFLDNRDCDVLASMLENLQPAECHVPKDWSPDFAGMKVVRAAGVAVSQASKKSSGHFEENVKLLQRFVDFSEHDLSVLQSDEFLSLRAGTLLVAESSFGESTAVKLELLRPDYLVKISSSTLEGLHVFGGTHSLFKVLNYTRSVGGERMLKTWLRQPLRRASQIRERLDIVERFVGDACLRKTLHETSLRRIPDLQKLSQKLECKRATLCDLYKLYCGVREAAKIKELLENEETNECLAEACINPLSQCLPKLKKFEQLCEKTIDDEALKENEYRVKSGFDETLTNLGNEMTRLKSEIEKLLPKERRRLDVEEKVLKLECTAQHGYFFRVTLKDERLLRKKSGVNIFDSAKSGVKFRTPRLEELNSDFSDVTRQYEAQQGYIVEEILQIGVGFAAKFVDLADILSRLDCLVSLAVAAQLATTPYVKPEIIDGPKKLITLKQARHPILERMPTMANFIPNDVALDEGSTLKVITGPNLGGKSTYMRTTGLCVYMAQVGSFVPCSEATLSPVDAILVRMGAGDSQQFGVSTFMAEMLDASRILRNATNNSLVLVDELGRGTSTFDGFGLAWAIAFELASVSRSPTLFATHFHEMTRLADELSNVSNLFCDALVDDEAFTLLYQIKPGICRKSYAVQVAKLAGFPEEVLKDARESLEQTEKEFATFQGSSNKRKAELVEGSSKKNNN